MYIQHTVSNMYLVFILLQIDLIKFSSCQGDQRTSKDGEHHQNMDTRADGITVWLISDEVLLITGNYNVSAKGFCTYIVNYRFS